MSTPHLIGAIRAFLVAQPQIALQLVGGISDGQAGRDDALPYCVLEVKDLRPLRIMGGKEIQWIRLEVSTYAAGRATAEDLGNAIRDAILPVDDSPPWTPLAIADGWQDVNRQPAGGDAIEIDPETRAAFGKDVWVCRRPISWTIARG